MYKINYKVSPTEICKKDKVLKNKTVSIKEKRGLSSSPHHFHHKNPNQYNGEFIGNQVFEGKNTYNKKVYIESYGCQMNFADSEVVASILSTEGFETTTEMKEADLVLINTCSIRDKAEQTVRKRLEKFNAVKRINPKMKVGVLGCMAERLKHKFLEGTYGDIAPVRLQSNGVSAYVSITRGCDNMCTFCVVPFTRGRERSRDPKSVLEEVHDLASKGFKEITLLGQNVDSYLWYGGGLKKDFDKATELQQKTAINFSQLLALVAQAHPKMRIRFSTSNPQDLTLDVIHTMATFDNICKHIHLPVQSGSDRILKKMNRLHTRQEYFDLIDNIRNIIPTCSISQDLISGFPTETEEDHQDTLSLMDYVQYHFGFMFSYSERPGTSAERKLDDDISEEVKLRRLREIIEKHRVHSRFRTAGYKDQTVCVLIERESKKSALQWSGRTTQNTVVVFAKENYSVGDFVDVKVNDCTSATLIGTPIGVSEII